MTYVDIIYIYPETSIVYFYPDAVKPWQVIPKP